ncbi:outer membrane beta-barrel protein [Marinilabilia salmonicolor]|uniref:outer membrane beta-barrel protein n=1 Tax=Marinilabilia salmonicolor TaxID=989 RepID=UPI00029B23D8|nr:outer membrane beta-barrel protein [Marinilabilia salmonicolor]
MKRIVFSITFTLIMFISASAQEGTMWLGGTINISSNTSNDLTTSRTTLMPEFGYNLNSSWAIGGRLGFSTLKDEDPAGTQKNTTTSIIPFARYSFANLGNFKIFGQGELPLNFYGGEFADGTSMDSSNSIGLRVRPGITYAFNENWGFNMLMPSVFAFTSSSNDTSSFKFGINDGYSVQEYLLNTAIGFIYKF